MSGVSDVGGRGQGTWGEGREGVSRTLGRGRASRILGRAGRRHLGGAWPLAAPSWTGRGLEGGGTG